MQVDQHIREFRYNGVSLPDPSPQYSLEQVREFYAAMYPEITSAAIEGPENIGAKALYTFRRAVGTKGNDHPVEDTDLLMRGHAIELIAQERQRQINEKGFTTDHDDEHEFGELAMVAALYASPIQIFGRSGTMEDGSPAYSDPWPGTWDKNHDARRFAGEIVNPETYTDNERFRLLVKAGALIVAEMERMQRWAIVFKDHGHR